MRGQEWHLSRRLGNDYQHAPGQSGRRQRGRGVSIYVASRLTSAVRLSAEPLWRGNGENGRFRGKEGNRASDTETFIPNCRAGQEENFEGPDNRLLPNHEYLSLSGGSVLPSGRVASLLWFP